MGSASPGGRGAATQASQQRLAASSRAARFLISYCRLTRRTERKQGALTCCRSIRVCTVCIYAPRGRSQRGKSLNKLFRVKYTLNVHPPGRGARAEREVTADSLSMTGGGAARAGACGGSDDALCLLILVSLTSTALIITLNLQLH